MIFVRGHDLSLGRYPHQSGTSRGAFLRLSRRHHLVDANPTVFMNIWPPHVWNIAVVVLLFSGVHADKFIMHGVFGLGNSI